MDIKVKSWKDINLKQYKKILDITKRELDSDLEKNIAVLSVLTSIPEDKIYDMNLQEVQDGLRQISWLTEEKYKYNPNLRNLKKIVIDGEEYEINPNINNFTVAQYLDFQHFWEKREEYMGNLLAVFIVPRGKKYNEGYDVIELADRLEEVLNLDYWNNICFFFLMTSDYLMRASIKSSVSKLKKMIRKEKDPKKKIWLEKKLMEITNVLP